MLLWKPKISAIDKATLTYYQSMDVLQQIVERKKEEVEAIHISVQKRTNSHAFLHALQKPGLSVIAEIKRKSPSKGYINPDLDAHETASKYEAGGAAAISVLTDKAGFGGSLADLEVVKQAVKVPVLQKEFIIDPVQVFQAIAINADAVLLIVRVLGERTKEFVSLCDEHGIDALVEVHDKKELEIAVSAGAKIIGINNRDLASFTVDFKHSEQLVSLIPADCVRVAESGVKTVDDAHSLHAMGFDAVLVGEALVRSADPQSMIQEMSHSS